jgi:hypothetical protein
MKTFVAVARREIVEKRFVFWTALGCSVLPWIVVLIHVSSPASRREIRDLIALVMSLGLGAGVALATGGSMFAGDLLAKRMGFYFSRPISATSLWAGKLVAAIVLTAGAFAIAILPTLLVDGREAFLRELPIDAPIIPLLLAALVLAMSAFATAARSRSRWGLIDFAALTVVALLWVWVVTQLVRELFHVSNWMNWTFAAIGVFALALASWMSIARGRTDIVAAHAAQTRTLWPLLAAPAIALLIYLVWATSAPATAISKLHWASTAGSGNGWVVLSARARGLEADFLYQPSSGRSHRLPSETTVAVSDDGRTAVWFDAPDSPNQAARTLISWRLDDPGAKPKETQITLRGPSWPLLLSPDGSRVAVLAQGTLSVYELPSGRSILTATLHAESGWGGFLGRDRLRFIASRWVSPGHRSITSLDADLARHASSITGTAEDLGGAPFLDPSSGLFFSRGAANADLELRDATSLLPIASLAGTASSSSWSGAFRGDRIFVGVSDGHESRIRVYTKSGAPIGQITLGSAGRVRIGGEPSMGQLLIDVVHPQEPPSSRSRSVLYLVDLEQGISRKVAEDLHPIVAWFGQGVPPGSEATKMFMTTHDQLVRFDPTTGERKVLLGGS